MIPGIRELNFGILGLGYFGKNYARLLGEIEGVKLGVAFSRSSEAFSKYAEILSPSTVCVTDPFAILDDPAIDCVIIATPPSTHFEFAKAALENGKHVLLEKPMVATLDEAEKLQDIVKRCRRVFMVGHQYCYHDYVRHLKAQLAEGVCGSLRYIIAEHFSPGPIRYDIGCLWEMATHEFSILDYLFGPQEIKEVRGMKTGFSGTRGEDAVAFEIQLARGPLFTLTCSWWAPMKVRRMILAGDKGVAVFDDREEQQKLRFLARPYPPRTAQDEYSRFLAPGQNDTIVPVIQAQEPLRNELAHLIECVREEKKPLTDIAHGMRVTRMLHEVGMGITVV